MFTFNKEKNCVCFDYYRAECTQQTSERFNHCRKFIRKKLKITTQHIFIYYFLSFFGGETKSMKTKNSIEKSSVGLHSGLKNVNATEITIVFFLRWINSLSGLPLPSPALRCWKKYKLTFKCNLKQHFCWFSSQPPPTMKIEFGYCF